MDATHVNVYADEATSNIRQGISQYTNRIESGIMMIYVRSFFDYVDVQLGSFLEVDRTCE